MSHSKIEVMSENNKRHSILHELYSINGHKWASVQGIDLATPKYTDEDTQKDINPQKLRSSTKINKLHV